MHIVAKPAEVSAAAGRQAFLVLVCTSAPSFMLQLDANIVSVSLPAIARSLNANFAGIEWVITAYMLSFASLLLPAGALADRFGRKRLLVTGLSVFTFASLLCGAAPNLTVLVAARALQGAGAAMQLSSALATLSHTFQGEARARAFAFWGSVVGIGISCGPVVGGLITQGFGWEWAFYVNVPIGAALIALIVKVIASSKDPGAQRLDLLGVACFAGALFLTTLALIEGNHRGWADRWIVEVLTSALVLFGLFITVERKRARPMLDLSYFRKPTYLGANLAQLSFSAGMLTMLTFIPIFLQSGLGHPSAIAGLMMLPMVLPLFIVPRIVASHLAHRLSGRALLTLGLFLVCLGLFWLAGVVKDLFYGPMIGGMLLTGIGAGFLNGETTKVGMTAIPKERSGMASGVSGTVRFSGLVIGIAAFGAVLYGGVAAAVRQALPDATASDGLRLVRDITAGHLGDVTLAGHNAGEIQALAAVSFAGGYQWLFLAAALFMLVSTLLTWRLVSAAETPPVSVSAEAPSRQVLRLLQPSRDHHPAHVKPQTCENLAANEGEMPTYTVTTANLTLTPAQESAIAAAITDAHHDNTGAPGFFAQVLFVALPERKHYIGGKLNKIPHIFVHGLIRAGRNADAKAGLIREITSNAREVSGVGDEDIWVYVQDIPPEQMVEFGRVLPEPGAEARCREGLSSSKRQELAAAGVTIWGPGEI